jgi:hypothetical protein
MKEDKMGGACRTYGETNTGFLCAMMKKTNNFTGLGIYWRIILTYILKKYGGGGGGWTASF